ncbi:NACHT domain-containing protein [Streptomyces sp. NPDC058992]|uniref:NACHT domain-containing protein n=1 Tax=Streptomyces sp. NPDC058992 TaxID=3346688 RepID=UPI00369EC8F2
MDYDLTRLGWREFEHLSQSLAKCVLGPGVSVFGDGKDGGREATFSGPVPYPHEQQRWDGYGVVQAKFKQRSTSLSSGTEWLERQIDAEIKAWLDPASKRGRLPEYLLFTTNVSLSAVPDTGGIARVERLISSYAANPKLSLKGWAVWHNEEICRYLDIHEGVRRAYAHFITPGDVFSRLLTTVSDANTETAELIRAHAGRELLTDQWVRLGQAGVQADQQKIRLGPVAVDLRAAFTHRKAPPALERAPIFRDAEDLYSTRAAAYILECGDTVLRPSHRMSTETRHILLIGGPGQGKSTLGQLICQAYRVALLDEEGEHLLTGEVRSTLHALRSDLTAIGLETPRGRRWPIRIALNQYANAILGGEDISLLRYLANKISHRSSEAVTAAHVKRWLRTWPCALVLDGLDEVVSPQTREDVMSRISDFLLETRQIDADLLVIATTRPQGYRGEFHSGDYETLTLMPLPDADALNYADRLAAARHYDDPEMRDTVLERIQNAITEEGTARLMRSPLQVTIMSLLVERRARMPQNRYELFDAYYNTIYAREVDKPGVTGQLLADHRMHIDWLHQHVGLLLQSRAAQNEELDALIEEEELRERTRHRLREETEDHRKAEKLADSLLTAATDRLVLLVAPDAGYIGFEVRSLQEYMAARALISGPEADIVPRLEMLVPSYSWRNTWMLAAAGIFTHRPHLRDDLINALRVFDSRDTVTMTLTPGAQLALDLLDDDVTRHHPRFHNLLVDYATSLIGQPPRIDLLLRTAATITVAANRHEQARTRIEHALKSAVSARDARLLTALGILAYMARGTNPVSANARRLLTMAIRTLAPDERVAASVLSSQYLSGMIPGLPLVTLEGHDVGSLSEYMQAHMQADPQQEPEVLQQLLRTLDSHLVDRPNADDISIAIVQDYPLDSVAALNAAGNLRAIAVCLDVIGSQKITGWQIVMAFTQLLDLLAYPILMPSDDPNVIGTS